MTEAATDLGDIETKIDDQMAGEGGGLAGAQVGGRDRAGGDLAPNGADTLVEPGGNPLTVRSVL